MTETLTNRAAPAAAPPRRMPVQPEPAVALPPIDPAAAHGPVDPTPNWSLTRRLGKSWMVIVAADVASFAVAAVLLGSGWLPMVLMGLFALLLFKAKGLYRPRLNLSVLSDLQALISANVVAGAALVGTVHVLGLAPGVGTFTSFALCAAAGQILLRAAAYFTLRSLRARGRTVHRTLILGGGQVGRQIARSIDERPKYGLRVAGYLDDDPMFTASEWSVPYLGGLDEFRRVIVEQQVTVLVVCFARGAEARVVDMLRNSRDLCDVFIVPRLYEVYGEVGNEHIGAVPVVRLHRWQMSTFPWKVKRLLDLLVSGMALLMLSPLLLATALAVRIDGGPGIFFRQQRVGLNGEAFDVFKFRSLRPADPNESNTTWNVANDKRMSALGKILRRTSIDELPQLWNVLRGDMSLVGPRPERPHFVEMFTEEHHRYPLRHRVPVGLTGLAQVNGLRGDTSIEDRVRFDNYYIENWSLWYDIKIIVATVREVLTAAGR